METKICKKCNEEKELNQFHNKNNTKDKKHYWCKLCVIKDNKKFMNSNPGYVLTHYQNNKNRYIELQKIRYINNRDFRLKQQKEYYLNNKKERDLYTQKWIKENKEYHNNYRNNYVKERKLYDDLFRLKCLIRNSIHNSFNHYGIKKYKKIKKSEIILGCSFDEFKLYLESKFESWMTWDNQGNPKDGIYEPNKTWDIDHIIPLSSAKNEEEIYKLNHFSNFQPLCSYNNRFIKRDNN